MHLDFSKIMQPPQHEQFKLQQAYTEHAADLPKFLAATANKHNSVMDSSGTCLDRYTYTITIADCRLYAILCKFCYLDEGKS